MNTSNVEADAKLIHALGGPTKVAKLIAIDKSGGAQRVQNWLTRGIPSHIKVQFPQYFMPKISKVKAKASAMEAPGSR